MNKMVICLEGIRAVLQLWLVVLAARVIHYNKGL